MVEAPAQSQPKVSARYKIPPLDECLNEVTVKFEITEPPDIKEVEHESTAFVLNTSPFVREEQKICRQGIEQHGHRPRPQINVKIPPPPPPFDVTSPPTQSGGAGLQLLESCIMECFPHASQPPLSLSPLPSAIDTLHALPRPLSGAQELRLFLRSSEEIEHSAGSLKGSYDSSNDCSSDSLISSLTHCEEPPSTGEEYPTLRSVVTGQSSLVARHRHRHLHSRRKSSRRDGRLINNPFDAPSSQTPVPGTVLSTATALYTRSQSSLMKLYLSQRSPAFSISSLEYCPEFELTSKNGLDTDEDRMTSSSTCDNTTNNNHPSDSTDYSTVSRKSSTRGDGRARRLFERHLLSSNNIRKSSSRLTGHQRLAATSAGTPPSPKSYPSAWSPLSASSFLRKSRQTALSVQLLSSPILSSLPPPPPPKPSMRLSFSLKGVKAVPKRFSEIKTASSVQETTLSPCSDQKLVARPLPMPRHSSFFQKRPYLYNNLSSSHSDSQISRNTVESDGSRFWKKYHGFAQLDDEDDLYENDETSMQGVHGGPPSSSPIKGDRILRKDISSASTATRTTEKKPSSLPHGLSSEKKKPHLLASWARVMTSWSSVNLPSHAKNTSSRSTDDVLWQPITTPSAFEQPLKVIRPSSTPTEGSSLMWTPNEKRARAHQMPPMRGPSLLPSALQRQSCDHSSFFSSGQVNLMPEEENTGSSWTNCNCYCGGSDNTDRLSCLLHKELPVLPHFLSSSLSTVEPLPVFTVRPIPDDRARTSKRNRGSMFFTAALLSLTTAVGGNNRDKRAKKQVATASRETDIPSRRSRRQSIMSFVSSKKSSRRSSLATIAPVNKNRKQSFRQDLLLPPAPSIPAADVSLSCSDEKKPGKAPSAMVLRAIERHAACRAVSLGPATPYLLHLRPGGSLEAPPEELKSHTRLTQHRRAILQQQLYQNPQMASAPRLPSVEESIPTSTASCSCSDLHLAQYDDGWRSGNDMPTSGRSLNLLQSSITGLVPRSESISAAATAPLTLETPGSTTKCERERIPFFEPFQANSRRGSGYVSFHFDLSHLEEYDSEQALVGPDGKSQVTDTPFEKSAGSDLTATVHKPLPQVPLFYKVFQRPSFLSSMPTLSAPTYSVVTPSTDDLNKDPQLATSSASLPSCELQPPTLHSRPRPNIPLLKLSPKTPQLLPRPLLSPEFLSSVQKSLKSRSQEFFYDQTSSSCSLASATPESKGNGIDSSSERSINGNKVSSSVDISSTTAFALPPQKQNMGSVDILSSSPASIASAVDSITRLNMIGSDSSGFVAPSSRQRRGPPPPPSRRCVQRVRSVLEGSEEASDGDNGDDTTDEGSDDASDPFRTLQEHLEQQQQQQQHVGSHHHHQLKLQCQESSFYDSSRPPKSSKQRQPTTLYFKDRILRGRRWQEDYGVGDTTSTALLSSSTTAFATHQLFIIDSQESALLAAPTSCYAKDESSSGKWANAPQQRQEQFDDRCYPGPCSPLTTTATAHEEDHGRGASSSQTSFWTLSAIQSGLLPTGPQSSSRRSTISTPYPPAQALMGSNLSGKSSLRSSTPPPELAAEKVLGRLTYPDGTKERRLGSPITEISVPLVPKKDHPIAAAEINASASDTRSPSPAPSPLDSSHPSIHCQYIQTSLTPLQQPQYAGRLGDLAKGPYSPIQAPFKLVGHNNKLGHIYFRKSPEIDYRTKANNGDSHLDDPCGTLSDDAVICAIQEYLRTFPGGEKGPSGLEYEAQEETSQSKVVAHPGTEAQKHLEMNLVLEDLERRLQEHSTAKTESATTLDQKFDTISSPGKVDRDTDVKCIETEGATTASQPPPQHKSPPCKAPCVEQEHIWPSFTAKRYQDCHIAVSQAASRRLPERRGKAPRLGPDLRLRSLSEQLSLEQESDKKCPSFQDARNLIDDWDKVVRDKEALMRKRIRSRAFRSEKHKWDLSRKVSSNIAYTRPDVGDLCLMEMNGQRTQSIFTGKIKDFGGGATRIRKRNERTSRSLERKGGHPSVASNVVLIRKQVEGGAAHTGGDGETTSTSGSALHKRKRDEEEVVQTEHKGNSSIGDIVIYKRKRIGEEPAPSGPGDNAIREQTRNEEGPTQTSQEGKHPRQNHDLRRDVRRE
ncbi:hypothetical protein EMPS_09650 [Entomortierella parvispora]|uniref:Uncharacterized protein n=1 Tax=Entomortierella parvispora TaxID=205924 RepID=A0A9P3M085_9FUNG|nr:hypothetical protein EMPS_09650 [Entomortierella parvispora]